MSLASAKRQDLIRLLRDQKLTVSFAESCTGGALSGFLTEQAGVSDIYLGSVVSYSNEAKMDLLGVRRDTLNEEGAVSESTALQMAQGVRRQLKTDWAVAVTGIAGPSGGTPAKPVGTVCFAAVGPDFASARRELFPGDRKAVQDASVVLAVNWLVEILADKTSP